jgi:site-specific DNA-cytosine methylase
VNGPTCGSLFSGAGLLDIGLHLAGFQHAWLCESDHWRRDLLRVRFPGVPVYDDIRTLGDQAPMGAAPVDLIAGGFPCKGVSAAGNRAGFGHPETVLWRDMARTIRDLRPRYVLVENVADLLVLHDGELWAEVVGTLAALGYDVRWDCVPAGAVGAPHLRDRVFAVATNTSRVAERAAHNEAHAIAGSRDTRALPRQRDPEPLAPADAEREPLELRGGAGAVGEAPTGSGGAARQQRAGGTPAHCDQDAAADTAEARRVAPIGTRQQRGVGGDAGAGDDGVTVDWGEYAPAIHRWEAIHGPAPQPLVRRVDDGSPGVRRLRARVDRSRLSALGDGVHVYVGWLVGLAIRGHMRTGTWE